MVGDKIKSICKTCFSNFIKSLIFVTSYIPLFILIIINDFDDLTCKSVLKTWKTNRSTITFIFILSIISLIITWMIFSAKRSTPTVIDGIKTINENILEYFVTYLILLLEMELGNPVSMLVNGIIFLIIGIYQISANKLYLNIFLIFLGYNLYEYGNGDILISKKNIDELRINPEIKVNKLGNISID